MELDEMKDVWQQMSQKLDHQKKLTDKLIFQMSKDRYKNKLNNILIYESIGTLFCFAIVTLTALNFHKLETWYLELAGVITIILYVVSPLISVVTVYRLKEIKIEPEQLNKMMNRFYVKKKQFILGQKMNIIIGLSMILSALPVAIKVFDNEDIFYSISNFGFKHFIFLALLLSLGVLFASWAFRGYLGMIRSAESILKEIDE